MLELKKWRKTLDKYLMTGNMDSESYEQMDGNQKMIIQSIKKSFERIKRLEGDDEEKINQINNQLSDLKVEKRCQKKTIQL